MTRGAQYATTAVFRQTQAGEAEEEMGGRTALLLRLPCFMRGVVSRAHVADAVAVVVAVVVPAAVVVEGDGARLDRHGVGGGVRGRRRGNRRCGRPGCEGEAEDGADRECT